MGDVISSHLDEGRRQYIAEHTGKLLTEFGKIYEEQYGVALFNSVRYEIEGNGGPQTQLLHRKTPLKDRVIFSGNLFQFVEDTKKWRNRFCLVPHHYGPVLYDNNIAYERGLQPRAGINCAGYRVLTSLDQYTELLNNTIPGGKVKTGSTQMKCATEFPVILWHPYCRHYQFCVMTEREQQRWSAVFQDCVRHCNNGTYPEDARVESAAFTDSVRLYRQARDQYGTWDMLCGNQVQVLSNLVMDSLVSDLKNIIGPKLRGKPQERQRVWLLISDTIYRMVHEQCRIFYDGLERRCSERRAEMESQIRTDMDQIIACKEHVSSKIRAAVLPKAELCVRNHVQAHIPSILDALMVPTSQGFSEVRELIFTEVTDMNKNLVNEGGRDKLGEHMEKISQLGYHPVKMQQCYEKMDHLNLEGLQQRFDVGSPSVFKQRAQILMRELTDNAVYTFEQLIHQEVSKSEEENLCRDIQRILERVLKKYDYDSSSVRKKFFQEALLQIVIPFLLKKLAPTCKSELPRYQELIFEELSRFVLVENTYEEVVLQTVMRDIVQAVKDAATQRKHNLFRDSMVMHNSDPNLHLLGEGPPIDWTEEYPNNTEPTEGRHGRARQVVSLIQEDEVPEFVESCQEAPANANIPEELESTDVSAIRGMLVKEFDVEVPLRDTAQAGEHTLPEEQVTPAPRSHAPHITAADLLKGQKERHTPSDVVDHNVQESVTPKNVHLEKELVKDPQASVHGGKNVHSDQEEETHHNEISVHDDQEGGPHHNEVSVHVEKDVHSDQRGGPHQPITQETTDDHSSVQEHTLEVLENKAANHVDYVGHTAHEEHPSHEKTVHPPVLPLQVPPEVIPVLVTPSEEETPSEVLQSSTSLVVHSTPDDSGFQSPMSEEEEDGEGYREIPVPDSHKKEEVITQF
ncbi:protein Niban 2 [Hyperolius riggenbachi]|uniref:protein Niban 2 n=1 Tax=Hyperolius riggenbachi TaxID=752182 RepID=UPI0035A3CD99